VVLRHSRITSIPRDIQIAGSLSIRGARQFRDLPEDFVVPGNLDLSDCPALVALPAGLRVERNLLLRRCGSLKSLPEGLEVGGALDLRGCRALTGFPRKVKIGAQCKFPRPRAAPFTEEQNRWRWQPGRFLPALWLRDCVRLTELPDDLEVGGLIEVAGSGLRDLPATLADTQLLWRGVLVPPEVVFHPERLGPHRILREENAELRRVMLERVGLETTLGQCGAQTIHADTDAGGPRRLVYIEQLRYSYLLCRCPSTGRQYLLRVPNTVQTCHEAAAWMAGFNDPSQYRPELET